MNGAHMIPLGYMLKKVASPAPEWMNAPAVSAVHSLSNCISDDFGDYISLWNHNGWWLFDSGDTVAATAVKLGVDPKQLTLFYYEAYDKQYDEDRMQWEPFKPDEFATQVEKPAHAKLSGFDVVTFWAGNAPECSPLSCCGLASDLPVNEKCLFDTFDEAVNALKRGDFRNSEPGPYRIIAVYEAGATTIGR